MYKAKWVYYDVNDLKINNIKISRLIRLYIISVFTYASLCKHLHKAVIWTDSTILSKVIHPKWVQEGIS